MSSALHEQPYLESWRWMSRQIRCAMDPDEPRLIEHYLAEGRYLACCTATSPWTSPKKKAYQQGRPLIDVALEHTDLTRSQLEELLNPEKLTADGV